MKFIALLLPLLGFISQSAYADISGFKNECFKETVFLSGTATGGSGKSYSSPKPFVDGTLMTIPANTLINRVYMVVDVAITGTTDLDVGDDDDADGYIDGSLSVTLGSAGLYGWNAKLAGAYLRVQTAGATDAADIYVVPNAKFYSSAKSLLLDATTTNTAGKARVVVEGCRMQPTGL